MRGTALLLLLTLFPPCALAQHADHAGHAQTSAQESEDGSQDLGQHGAHPSPDSHALPRTTEVPASPAPLPPPTAEERAAAFPDLHGMDMRMHMDDDPLIATLRFDRLEWQDGARASGLGWELAGWLGGNRNRLWLRSEGERRSGVTEHADVELLWGRATGPWWDVLAGVRHDVGHGPSRDWLAFGVQGLAPYKFEIAATGYAGRDGRFAARLESEYELLLTNRLILQPRAEANLYNKDDPLRGIGKGLNDIELGMRLRYEVTRQFAPYVGYTWTRRFGEAANLSRDAGGDRSEANWVAGLRFWF